MNAYYSLVEVEISLHSPPSSTLIKYKCRDLDRYLVVIIKKEMVIRKDRFGGQTGRTRRGGIWSNLITLSLCPYAILRLLAGICRFD